MDLPFYSLYYYQKATSLRPFDFRIWSALGSNYELIGRYLESIKCIKRGLIGVDPSEACRPIYSLGRLYEKINNKETSSYYYKMLFSGRISNAKVCLVNIFFTSVD